MADVRQVLNFMPMRGGLATAGQRSTIDEGQLWSAENIWPDLDGMLRSRPGLIQAGQYLKSPSALEAGEALRIYEAFSDLNQWSVGESAGTHSYATVSGMLKVSMTTGALYFGRVPSDLATGGSWSVRFTARMINPAGPDTTGGDLRVIARGAALIDPIEVRINANGISTVVSTSPVLNHAQNLDLGGFHTYEFRFNYVTEDLQIYVDEVLEVTVDAATLDTATYQTTSTSLELQVTAGTGAWAVEITDLLFRDTYATPFNGEYIRSVGEFNRRLTGGSVLRSLLVATGSYAYADIGVRGAWRPILAVRPGDTFMLPFQEQLLLFDDDGATTSRLFTWDGIEAPESIDDAPPVRFGAEYRSRLWAAGDRDFPLRVYFTGSRQADVWFAPEYDSDETYDEVINAGFIVIPSEAGDEVTGLYGDIFASLFIITLKGIWRLSGSSPASFQVENVTKKVGGESPNGFTQIGNDLYVVGRYGVVALSGVESFGDVQAAMPSGAIADKWSSLPAVAGRLDRSQLASSYLVYLPSLNVALMGARLSGSNTLNGLYAFSPLAKQWYGPWDIEPTCFKVVEVGVPAAEVLIHGHEDGRVTFTGLSVQDDGGTFLLRSPMLSGRSVDPTFTDKEKRWRVLRLFILPRVGRDFTVRWRVDFSDYHSVTKSQRGDDEELLPYDTDFRLDVDNLLSDQDVMVIEIDLDEKGYYLQFEIESDYEFVYQGCQVEFLVSQ